MKKILAYCILLSVLAHSTLCNAQKKVPGGQATYNSSDWGGFIEPKKEPVTGPNLLKIAGGTFVMGETDQEAVRERRVTISTFYLDATEVPNKQYRQFVAWMQQYEPDYPLSKLLPDTSFWLTYYKGELGKKLATDYYRNQAFDYFPVLGISWDQASKFCQWRSNQVNKDILIKKGYLKEADLEGQVFNTKEYLAGKYKSKKNNSSEVILLPSYRLPTEAEWEFAALAKDLNSDSYEGYKYAVSPNMPKHSDRRIKKMWKKARKHQKKYPLPNYYTSATVPLPKNIFEGELNNYGLFNLNDNATEWVQDVYRPTSIKPHNGDINPFAANNQSPKDSTTTAKTAYEGRVIKGASFQDKKGTVSPGNRWAAGQDATTFDPSTQLSPRPMGFRAAMTYIGSTKKFRELRKSIKK